MMMIIIIMGCDDHMLENVTDSTIDLNLISIFYTADEEAFANDFLSLIYKINVYLVIPCKCNL